jgi:magnesium-transporting ATPase (P-type)
LYNVEEVDYIDTNIGPFGENAPEDNLVLLGILGIKDPLRPEVWGSMCVCVCGGVFHSLF